MNNKNFFSFVEKGETNEVESILKGIKEEPEKRELINSYDVFIFFFFLKIILKNL
jgi:hypothetical protein